MLLLYSPGVLVKKDALVLAEVSGILGAGRQKAGQEIHYDVGIVIKKVNTLYFAYKHIYIYTYIYIYITTFIHSFLFLRYHQHCDLRHVQRFHLKEKNITYKSESSPPSFIYYKYNQAPHNTIFSTCIIRLTL